MKEKKVSKVVEDNGASYPPSQDSVFP
ncbi:MAG: hypothetical protein ACI97B_002449, partial [Verrucomicrobiales bacterium]